MSGRSPGPSTRVTVEPGSRADPGSGQIGAPVRRRHRDGGQHVAPVFGQQNQGRRGAPGVDGHGAGGNAAVGGHGRTGERSDEGDGFVGHRCRCTGQPPELGRQRRAEEGCIGQSPAELLGDDRDLHPGGERRASIDRYPKLAPARGGNGGVEPVGPLGVVELADGAGSEPVDDLGSRVAQRSLLGGEADVHHALPVDAARTGVHWSRSVRRNTFPEGSRGMVSTKTTWRSCL